MARLDQTDFAMRVVIDRPVIGAKHSLQAGNQGVLDPKCSEIDQPLAPDFSVRMGLGPTFFGDQVRREGPTRRFVSIRIGQLAGVAPSPWSRRMTIDIHGIERDWLGRAAREARILKRRAIGAGARGWHSCLRDVAAGRASAD
ncbi:hypothetical protein J2W40_001648 [Sphingobium xenophagum]|uniref:Uncharacterized protein n=1 Tax=Sphingobium xenophagum TaxID=121428 RepID=A0ABU1WZU3_SPHXE|nr:DUF5990 family protein [Sphingobium xenophagum]MDR7154833.1 hypothetical protein [Sphingobium xenophagum]